MGSARGRRSVEGWKPCPLDDVITTNHHQTARIITSNAWDQKGDMALSGII
jgi:hypothetical protein